MTVCLHLPFSAEIYLPLIDVSLMRIKALLSEVKRPQRVAKLLSSMSCRG